MSSLDFRALVALNFACSVVTVLAWIATVRLVNGRKSLVDTVPVFLVLGLGFNSFAWGFSFQFVLSTLFLSISIFFMVSWLVRGSVNSAGFATIALVITAWSGGNGALCAVILAIGYANILRHKIFKWQVLIPLIVLVVSLAFIISGWSPSSATQQKPELFDFIQFVTEFSKAWLAIFAITYPSFTFSFTILFVVSVIILWFTAGRLRCDHLSNVPSVTYGLTSLVITIIIMVMFVLFITAFTRAGSQPWQPGLELHYGYLALPLPLSCWLLVSISPKSMVRKVICILLVLISLVAYFVNAAWRVSTLKYEFSETASVVNAIVSSVSADQVAERHFNSMYWGGKEGLPNLANGITLLRGNGIWVTRGHTQ